MYWLLAFSISSHNVLRSAHAGMRGWRPRPMPRLPYACSSTSSPWRLDAIQGPCRNRSPFGQQWNQDLTRPLAPLLPRTRLILNCRSVYIFSPHLQDNKTITVTENTKVTSSISQQYWARFWDIFICDCIAGQEGEQDGNGFRNRGVWMLLKVADHIHRDPNVMLIFNTLQLGNAYIYIYSMYIYIYVYIYTLNWVITGSGIGLLPWQHHASACTNDVLVSIRP